LLLQILDMTNGIDLARHLGHDTKTHIDFYRLSDSTVQLSKVHQGFSDLLCSFIFKVTASSSFCHSHFDKMLLLFS